MTEAADNRNSNSSAATATASASRSAPQAETAAGSATLAMDEMWGDASATGQANDPRLRRFLDDKYSMFIHWGLYSHLAGAWRGRTYRGIGEWIMHPAMADIPVDEYRALATEFDPQRFDARAIARLARAGGMRAIVITAKHHEGFAMFDSQASDFTIVKASPFGRDPMRELADACRQEGLRLGFYYSQFQDWTEPDGGGSRCPPSGRPAAFDRYFNEKVIPQVTELLTNYGTISFVWFDTPGTMGKAYSQQLVDLVHRHQPECLVNSRVGNGLGDYATLGDMEIPVKTPVDGGAYECVDTTNDSWAYARHDRHWKSPSTIVRNLLRVAARGCSFMLNIGPRGDGSIPGIAVRALEESGAWIRANAEAVYGVARSPFPPFTWGDCTVGGKNLYVHVFDWPHDRRLRLGAVAGRVQTAELLATGEGLPFIQNGDLLALELPVAMPNPLATVIRLGFDSVPGATDQALQVDGQFAAFLPAEYAATQGAVLESSRWMELFGEWKKSEHLTGWKSPSDSAVWQLNVLDPGLYIVAVDYACTPYMEGAEWQLATEADAVTFSALDTGQRAPEEGRRHRMRYRTVEIGVIHFARAGRQELKLSPGGKLEAPGIQVARIVLMPWTGGSI